MSRRLRAVFDVNIWLYAFFGPDSEFPYLQSVPPATSNSSADCLSLALDGDRFSVFTSPHILTNIARVLRLEGVSEVNIKRTLEDFVDIVHLSQGSVLDPERKEVHLVDHEDNFILDLLISANCDVLVTSDRELLANSGYKGRMFLSPRDFVRLALTITPE